LAKRYALSKSFFIKQKALFNAIEKFSKDFTFGIQTNAVLLEEEAAFLRWPRAETYSHAVNSSV